MKKTAQAFSVAIIGALALGARRWSARAECYVQAPLPPVHRSYIRRDVVEPGVYEVGRSPAVYGWTHQAVGQPGAVDLARRALRLPHRSGARPASPAAPHGVNNASMAKRQYAAFTFRQAISRSRSAFW